MNLKDPTIQSAVKGYCEEISASMSRMQGERDLIKEATDDLAEKYELDKKLLKKMAKTYHASNFSNQQQENEAFVEAYQQLFGIQDV